MQNITSFHFFEPETFISSNNNGSPKRRVSNMFISYRKEMMIYKPHNMSMTEYSKLVSSWWKKIPNEVKTELQRRYQINRDQKLQNKVNETDQCNGDNNFIYCFMSNNEPESSKNENVKLQSRYQSNQDQNLQNKTDLDHTDVSPNPPYALNDLVTSESILQDQVIDCESPYDYQLLIPNYSNSNGIIDNGKLFNKMIRDCYLTDIPSEIFFNNDLEHTYHY
ncbi:9550_t:CDS:1 [Funneliformis caledonium]|uniref:9550_t:CDS:1 n=1 Tax=Funneliformis caledonium TaxID=1117310 RepID=A0A9N9C8N6_9GLOM|nr:9550_t:CDS:1 [Funneliformis caledonium]